MHGVVVVARRLSETHVQCTTPQGFAAGYTAVALSTNGRDFSEDTALYEFQPPIVLRAILPTEGVSSGGLPVRRSGPKS